MKTLLTTLLILLGVGMTFAQKSEFEFDKKNMQFSDASGVVFVLEKVKSMSVPGASNYYFNNTSGKQLILITLQRYETAKAVSQNNPNGTVIYYEMNFLGLDKKAEIDNYTVKRIGQIIYERKLIVGGELNREAVNSFVMETGTRFSNNRGIFTAP